MATKISRAKLAKTVTKRLLAGDKTILRQLAAYLVQTHRTHESELVARDIEALLSKRGRVLARVTSPRSLTDELRNQVEVLAKSEFGKDAKVEIEHEKDETLLAGMKVAFAGKQIDVSAKAKLAKLEKLAV